MSKSKAKSLLEKSISAIIAAIEIYNKPDFEYREEAFIVLLINGWETLLKSKILKDNKNRIQSIYVKRDRSKRRPVYRRNRAGNYMTIGIYKCLGQTADQMDRACIENIKLLIDVRDPAMHFYLKDPFLKKKVYELGTASLINYVRTIQDWFKVNLAERYNFYIMPISFDPPTLWKAVRRNRDPEIQKFLEKIGEKEKKFPSDESKRYNFTLQIEVNYTSTHGTKDIDVQITDNPKAAKFILKEAQILEKFPFDYNKLIKKLKERYSDFSAYTKFYKIKKNLEQDTSLVYIRPYNLNAPKSGSKKYYSEKVFQKFDKFYKKRSRS